MTSPAPICWHVITGEYPPDQGGVSEYTRQVAQGLAAAGDTVNVWAPDAGPNHRAALSDPGVAVHRMPGRFGRRTLGWLDRELDGWPRPRRLLVQYVPHAFGWKGGNVPFCRWVAGRRRDEVWIVFHEVAFPLGREYTLMQNGLGLVNRAMASMASRSAQRIFVTVPGWRDLLAPLVGRGTPIPWLPVPSGIPVVNDPGATARLRARYGQAAPLIGHFGTYGRLIRPTLDAAVGRLLTSSPGRVLLIGRGSDAAACELRGSHPDLADRVAGTGELAPDDVSRHLGACDLMLQPYPDGVSTRRTSAMAALAHGKPLVTTRGWLTESLWDATGAVALAPADDLGALVRQAEALVADATRRADLATRGRALYDARFDLRHVVEALRS